MPLLPSPVCPILIAREALLAHLDEALPDAHAGRGHLVLLLGEAGASKSRLVREVVPRACAAGFDLLIGGCAERDRDFPFAPIVDALRQRLIDPATDPHTLFGAHFSTLAELPPELPATPSASTAQALSPERDKRRLFEAVVALLSELAARRPLFLALEDLHWADPTSLELLELLP